jgi:hypothetical protein
MTQRQPPNAGRPWQPLPPFDPREVGRPVPATDIITRWPSSSVAHGSATARTGGAPTVLAVMPNGSDAHLVRPPTLLDHLQRRLRHQRTVAEAGVHSPSSSSSQGKVDEGVADRDAAADEAALTHAQAQLAALRDATRELRQHFKTYAPLFDDYDAIIGLAHEQTVALGQVNAALRADYGVAEAGALELATRFKAREAALNVALAEATAELETLKAAQVGPTSQRREMERLEKNLVDCRARLQRAQAQHEEQASMLVTKSVAIYNMQGDARQSAGVIESLREQVAERDSRLQKLVCENELIRLSAERSVATKDGELTQAQRDLAQCRSDLAAAQRDLREWETDAAAPSGGSPASLAGSAASGGGGGGGRNRGRRKNGPGAAVAPEYDWTRLVENKDALDLYEMDAFGEPIRHMADMCEAERIRHVVSQWRRTKGYLKLADEFITAHGLVRDGSLVQDIDSATGAAEDDGAKVAASITATTFRPLLFPYRLPTDRLALADALADDELHFVPIACPPGPAYLDATLGVTPPSIGGSVPTVGSKPQPHPSEAAFTANDDPQLASSAGPPPVKGIRLSLADAAEELHEFFAFYRRGRKTNVGLPVHQAFPLWLNTSKYTHDPSRRLGFAYSLWHAVEAATTSVVDAAPIDCLLFVAMYTGDLPPDFLEDFGTLVADLRGTFRRRTARGGSSITRAALQTVIRRVLASYETEELESLMRAADASIPYAAAGTFEEAPLFAGDSPFMRTLCLQHFCGILSIRRAMISAVAKIAGTPASVAATQQQQQATTPRNEPGSPSLIVPLSKSLSAREPRVAVTTPAQPAANTQAQAPASPPRNGAFARKQSVAHLMLSAVQQQQQTGPELVRYSDVFKALVSVDPDQPKREIHAFLSKALGWDLERYGVMPINAISARNAAAVPPVATDEADEQSGHVSVAAAAAGAATLEDVLRNDLSEAIPVDVESEHQAVLRRKALMTELNERWMEKRVAVEAVGRYTCRRVSNVPAFPYVRDLPRTVYGIRETAAPPPPVKAKAAATSKSGGAVGSRRR